MAEYKGKLFKGLFTRAKNVLFDDDTCPFDFSETEQIDGTWLGETRYRKTINFGVLPNNTTKAVNHNISNLKNIVDIRGIAWRSDGATNTLPTASVLNQTYNINVFAGSTTVSVQTAYDYSNFTNSYITIRYTKTS